MRSLLLSLVAVVGLSACGGPAQIAAPDSIDRMEKAEVEAIVREYLLREPEMLFEMQRAYEIKDQMQQVVSAEAAWDKLIASAKDDPSVGPKNAAITIIEFTDYDCAWCKRVLPTMLELADDRRGDVRIVFKELHWQGSRDGAPSRAALAAHKQGKYRDMHVAMMNAPAGALTPENIETMARSVGLDIPRWKADMLSPGVNDQIDRFQVEAQAASIRGTPGFLVNGTFFGGGGDMVGLKSLIDAKRAELKNRK